ncbi:MULTISPECIES: hypothetical protein [Aquimarina]|uniref:hypothetical protein n=1 Tax=Aquimarina TaxID=290174 RepID=UPI0009441E00|nr:MULTISPECIES: hypothetical protein [Aquimarina]
MNTYLCIAGILCFLLGIVHSILGEYLIFNSKRNKGSLVPSKKNEALKERHLRILWATWHLASVFGWGIGAILIKISAEQNELNPTNIGFIIQSIMYTMFLASLLVLVGTKGKHPGWVVLLLIGILLVIGN